MYEFSPGDAPSSGSSPAAAIAYGDRADAVYAWVLNRIITVEFEPGAFLDKQAIADAVGVSRQPVTVALSRLAREGWVEIENRVGSYVARINPVQLRELIFLWGAFNSLVLRELMASPPPGMAERMAQIHDDFASARAAGDATRAREVYDGAFEYILGVIENDKARTYFGMLRAHFQRLLMFISRSQQLHPALEMLNSTLIPGLGTKLEAIRDGNLEAALRASDGLDRALQDLLDAFVQVDGGA